MTTHELEPDLEDQFELSRQNSSPPTSNLNAPDLNAHKRMLYKAALRGDWNAAKTALNLDNSIACARITKRGETALHVAAVANQTAFVRNLVEHLNKRDLEIRDINGNTAFCSAAMSGVVEIAMVMYQKNENLPIIRNSSKKTPFEMAIWLRKRKMVEYLYPITPFQELDLEEIKDIFLETIYTDMYDISLMILEKGVDGSFPFILEKFGESALKVLARKPLSDNHSIQGRIWERFVSIIAAIPCITYFKRINSSLQMRRQVSELIKELWKQILKLPDSDVLKLIKETGILHEAAKVGNVEFLTLLTHSNPDFIWEINLCGHSIFHVAVINRQEKVFGLIYRIGATKDLITPYIDEEGNNILHLAGKIAPPSRLNIVSGAALQMQSELLWFKEVEKIVRPSYVQMENSQKLPQTPRELFMTEHEKLRDAGEKWMKDAATSCMVVATLIATVVFAAGFTVPGGYKGENGSPIFLNVGWFTIFVISDALAMFSSTASILTFLSLFTARYREDDFLFSLPAKLIVGLITLFASIICMVLTFTATFFLVYKEENQGTLPKFVATFAGLPIALYVRLNFKLWIPLIRLTFFSSRFMFRSGKHKLF